MILNIDLVTWRKIKCVGILVLVAGIWRVGQCAPSLFAPLLVPMIAQEISAEEQAREAEHERHQQEMRAGLEAHESWKEARAREEAEHQEKVKQ